MIQKLINHIVDTQFDDLPQEVRKEEKKFIIDSLGVAIAGSTAPGSMEIVDLVKGWGGKPEATLIAYGEKVPSPWAALSNSTMMHALDFDDTLDDSALHAHVSVLPAALAMAERRGHVSGKELINAVALGVDLVCRLGLATKRPLAWIRTSTCGSFGAAAVSAKILNFDYEKMLRALGIVYSQASGNAQCLIEGGLVKRMQPAFASYAGILSALLAEKGITGPRDFLEGSYGFFNLYENGDYDRERILSGLGKEYGGMKLSMKPYPSCRMTHASIDATLTLLKNHNINPLEIEEVVVRVSKMVFNMVGHPFVIRENPQVDAQFSIPYNVAVGIVKGDVSLRDFEDPVIRDPQVLELARRIRVEIDPNLPDREIMTADLQVKTKDNVFRIKVDQVKGNPLKPMDMDDCIKKFMKCVAYCKNSVLKERAKEILKILIELEQLEDVRDLMKWVG